MTSTKSDPDEIHHTDWIVIILLATSVFKIALSHGVIFYDAKLASFSANRVLIATLMEARDKYSHHGS